MSLTCLVYERVSKVRALQYSNGVSPFALWAAYLLFDVQFIIVEGTYTSSISTDISNLISFDSLWTAFRSPHKGNLVSTRLHFWRNHPLRNCFLPGHISPV